MQDGFHCERAAPPIYFRSNILPGSPPRPRPTGIPPVDCCPHAPQNPLAADLLQPDVGEALRLREERRRPFVRSLLERIAATRTPWPPARIAELEQLLFALTSFESFDVLAGPDRAFAEVAPLLGDAACAILAADA